MIFIRGVKTGVTSIYGFERRECFGFGRFFKCPADSGVEESAGTEVGAAMVEDEDVEWIPRDVRIVGPTT